MFWCDRQQNEPIERCNEHKDHTVLLGGVKKLEFNLNSD